jgi:glycosyltransferase involved in cell wall biosynthesis
MRKPLHVVVLADALGFPHGMAATSRVRLLSLALVERGHRVTVLSSRVTERPPVVHNQATSGQWRGVRFIYTTGTTVRHSSFWIRRAVEIKGIVMVAVWLRRFKRNPGVDCVYLWGNVMRRTVRRAGFELLLRSLRIPWVVELNELPWTLRSDCSLIEARTSPLSGAAGAVCISAFLERWARDWSGQHLRPLELCRIPIVVDMAEFPEPKPIRSEPLRVLYAADIGYVEELEMVLGAMDIVWRWRPDSELIITGWDGGEPGARNQLARIDTVAKPGNVVVAGRLPRSELIELYQTSAALLAPLTDTPRSHARFPTKIGEYLASGRPLVTTNIGEVGRVFADGVDAYVADRADCESFAEAIRRALDDREDPSILARRRRSLARQSFHYSHWGESLETLFELCSKVQSGVALNRTTEGYRHG